jgi:hypothetical protein
MLTATPRHWYSWNFAVFGNDGHLADIDVSWWREKGTLTVAGQRYGVHRERPMSGKFMLDDSSGSVLATAEKPSAFRRHLVIEHAGRRYELKPRGWFTRTFELHEGAVVVGSLSAGGMFSRRMSIDLPETLPLPVRIFLVWLTVILWKRDSEASSGGA